MDDYVRLLEAQNEELQQKLAKATIYDDAQVMFKDFVLHYFAAQANAKNDTVDKKFRAEHALESLLKDWSSMQIVDNLWGMTPMPHETFRGDPSETPDIAIDKFKMYLCSVLDEYRLVIAKEKEKESDTIT